MMLIYLNKLYLGTWLNSYNGPNIDTSKVEYITSKSLARTLLRSDRLEKKVGLCYNKSYNAGMFDKKYSNDYLSLYRFKSDLSTSKQKLEYRPNSLALEHISSGNPTTSEVINSLLLNQKVYISQKELDVLLSLPSVTFDLPITDQTYPALLVLIGKPGSKRSNAGIYFFSHKYLDKKYVGSSNDLARRFKQYFEKNVLFNNKDTGKLLPMIEKEELKAFTLEITVIPSSYPKYSHCFLEQFHLLNKKLNLNIHKIVNFRVNQGFNIYLYDKDCKILYYSSNSLNAFCADLGVHHSSYKKHIANNSPFLDYFTISNLLVADATLTNLTEIEVRELIDERRKISLNKLHLSYGKYIEVLDSDTNTTEIYESSYKVATRFGFSRSSLRNYIASGKVYKNRYIFKYAKHTTDH
uniref:hypothetical protein n=1 Tax=Dematophora necatrix TaxID=2751867 RepID=UPI0030E5B51E